MLATRRRIDDGRWNNPRRVNINSFPEPSFLEDRCARFALGYWMVRKVCLSQFDKGLFVKYSSIQVFELEGGQMDHQLKKFLQKFVEKEDWRKRD